MLLLSTMVFGVNVGEIVKLKHNIFICKTQKSAFEVALYELNGGIKSPEVQNYLNSGKCKGISRSAKGKVIILNKVNYNFKKGKYLLHKIEVLSFLIDNKIIDLKKEKLGGYYVGYTFDAYSAISDETVGKSN